MSNTGETPKKRGLGRGLSSLMADVGSMDATGLPGTGSQAQELVVPIEKIVPNPDQPRRKFDEEKLSELAESIGQKGVIQPLVVRVREGGTYEIVAGERRWRASQRAKLHELPVVVREYTDTEVLEIAIVENIQRADLNAIEEAAGYSQLMEKFGHTQEQLSSALGKSRSHIANMMRLLSLPTDVQAYLEAGKLSTGHARALITSDDPSELAAIVVKKGLSVRETERLAKASKTPKKVTKAAKKAPTKDADTRALESDLGAAIGLGVSIEHKDGGESGHLTISYQTLDDLDRLCGILSKG